MRVKSYKGKSLDKIYQTVQKELGPKAVIVSSKKCSTGSLLSPRGMGYELIAVADDASTDQSLVDRTFSGEAWEKFVALQAGQFRRMEQSVNQLRSEMRSVRRTASMEATSIKAVEKIPAYAKGWDARFIKKLKTNVPSFFRTRQVSKQRDALVPMLSIQPNFPLKQKHKPHIVALVGPTGSGKTTTVAKLAARWGLKEGLNVGLITTDTYRVAGVDQLQEYATLLGIDMKVAFTADEATRAVTRLADRDIILVDTAGRNHYDQESLKHLRGVLENMGSFTVVLTVPATSNKEQLPEVIKNYDVLNPEYLVITKIDETRNYDILTVARSETACPVAFYTNGQRVPQDIEVATVDQTVKMLLQR